MKLLVVEGNPLRIRNQRKSSGIAPYYMVFSEMLKLLIPQATVEVAFPADQNTSLPGFDQLRSYDGVLITGSTLSVLDKIPEVTRQLDFVDLVFESGTSVYGSCWGLQLATVVAGGTVGKCKNGLEFGISKPITLTDAGKQSPFFKNREQPFQAFCVHYDEIIALPEGAQVLAKNAHSTVQALTFDYKKSSFFGVQYHPEFSPQLMAQITRFMAKRLIDEGFFSSLEELENASIQLEAGQELPSDMSDYRLHTQEVYSWLLTLKGT